jgi:protein tyrosine phosphatase (PTP) superfamily phosphohydrolase (DUF442 family)
MLAINTFKTIAGYLLTWIHRYSKLPLSNKKLADICNYLKIDDLIATAGQPTIAQFHLIKNAGYHTVINLAPHTSANALPDERSIVESLDMTYMYIPVDFNHPTDQDFNHFCDVMQKLKPNPVFIHCAANMRVSAFLYRYRVEIRGEDRLMARQDLHQIWTPNSIWRSFIGES